MRGDSENVFSLIERLTEQFPHPEAVEDRNAEGWLAKNLELAFKPTQTPQDLIELMDVAIKLLDAGDCPDFLLDMIVNG